MDTLHFLQVRKRIVVAPPGMVESLNTVRSSSLIMWLCVGEARNPFPHCAIYLLVQGHQLGHGALRKVASVPGFPFVMLFHQGRAARRSRTIGFAKMPTIVSSFDFLVDPFQGICGPFLAPVLTPMKKCPLTAIGSWPYAGSAVAAGGQPLRGCGRGSTRRSCSAPGG